MECGFYASDPWPPVPFQSVPHCGVRIGVLKSFNTDRDDEVAYTLELVTEGLVDEGAVCECVEGDIPVLFAETENISLSHQRLSAGEKTCVSPQFRTFGKYTIHLLKGKVLSMTVLRRPTARAVHIAGAGRV